MTHEMVTYYARRAAEYDRVYALAGWQQDVAALQALVPAFFQGRRVFEVACGTGYWTHRIAPAAASVHATDLNEETLAIARARAHPAAGVTFERRDAYVGGGARTFDAGFAGFWLSHVDRARMGRFLDAFHSHLAPGARVLMFDERETPARRTPASRTDGHGNRYEMRTLENGDRFEIIKNYYDAARAGRVLERHGTDVSYRTLDRLWLLTYTVI